MKHPILLAGFVQMFLAAAVFAQGGDGEFRTFELTAVPPPAPALKYRLLIDPNEKRPGNAAVFYMRAALLSSQSKISDLVDKALDARDAKNRGEFSRLSAQVCESSEGIPDLMLLAAERDQCDWNTGLEERGFRALLPELNYMREIANFSSICAACQMEQGKIDDCVGTLRAMYELGQNVAKTPILVSGLVGVGITQLADDGLVELMKRNDSPNLYWALVALPRPIHDFRHAMQGEEGGGEIAAMVPLMAKARSQELSAAEWREMINQVSQYVAEALPSNKTVAKHDFDEDLKPGGSALLVLPAAQAHYAQSRQIPAGDVALLDSATVVATFYFDQFEQLCDDGKESLSLPYPQMLRKMKPLSNELEQMRAEAPANPFLPIMPSVEGAAETFAAADREVAALTAVEAIRSYASSHDGKLPEHLEDVTDTPVPANPMTGQPFEYRVEQDTAVLSSAQPAKYRLQFRIRIRK